MAVDHHTTRVIPGFSRYRVDEAGNLWATTNTRGNPCPWRKLAGCLTRKGYLRTVLRGDDGRLRAKMIHCLVLEAFVGTCPDGQECCHFDGDKTNNRLENLRWDTSKSNAADSIRLGRRPDNRGSNNGRARIDESMVIRVRARIASGVKARFIRAEFGLTINQYNKIRCGLTWQSVGTP